MITVTLQFPTIEEAQMVLERIKPTIAPKVEKVVDPKPAKAEKPAPTPPASATATPIPAPEPAPAETAVASPSEIDYATVAQAINDAVKVDRPRAIATLAKFGAKKGPDLKPEQWADFMKELA